MESDIFDFKFLMRIGLVNAASRYFKQLLDNAAGYRWTFDEHFDNLAFWAGCATRW
jgi:hypothetical protein